MKMSWRKKAKNSLGTKKSIIGNGGAKNEWSRLGTMSEKMRVELNNYIEQRYKSDYSN